MFESLFYTLTNAILSIVELLLSFRIILKFLGASPSAPFVSWIYETTQPLLAPFIGAFPSPGIQGGFVVEFSSLFALIVFAFIGYLVDSLFHQVKALTRSKKARP